MSALRVLDVGASEGYAKQILQPKFYMGVDPNPLAKGIVKGTLEHAEDCVRDGCGLFDVAIYCHVLEHIENPVDEVRRVAKLLAPNGILAIATCAADTEWGWKIESHVSLINEGILERWFHLAGLTTYETLRVQFRPGKAEVWGAGIREVGA